MINELSNYWRSWLVGLTQADRFDPLLTGKLAEVVERRVLDLAGVEIKILGPALEEKIFSVLAANPLVAFAELCGFRTIDPLLIGISRQTRNEFNTGVRSVIALEKAEFSDEEWPIIQAFLDRQLPVDESIIEVKQ